MTIQSAGQARDYRDLADAKIVTSTILRDLALAALANLTRAGISSGGGPNDGDRTWRLVGKTTHGTRLEMTCSGPNLPSHIPDETIRPADVGKHIPWAGVYRLVVKAPLIVLDLYWRDDAPLRILQFSRGDWEADILGLG